MPLPKLGDELQAQALALLLVPGRGRLEVGERIIEDRLGLHVA